jgi:uncharacterized protein
MEIIGRDDEISILNEVLEKNSSQFLAIYGRRRIGKTYLIRTFFTKNIVFECTALNNESDKDGEEVNSEANTVQQLENFWMQLTKFGYAYHVQPTTWLQAFYHLEMYITQLKSRKKKVIFLDELPWFDTQKGGFLPAFSSFWNQFCSLRKDLILVVCGSAASWIIDKIVNARGGLHNRLTRSFRMEPFTLAETKEYLAYQKVHMSDKELAKLYMCIGGIPYYLNGVQPGRSIPQILDDLFFSKNAFLKNEFINLFSSLFKKHENHLSIISCLSKTNQGLTRQDILQKTGLQSGGTLSMIIDELQECGFIEKYKAIDKNKEGGLYRLMDEFSMFYYKFIHNHKGKSTGNSIGNSHEFKVWSGYAFENLCFRHIAQISKILGINGILFDVYAFRYNGDEATDGAQIDMLIDRSDNCINIVEIKFYNGIYKITAPVAANIDNKESEKNMHHLSVVTNEITVSEIIK